MVDVTGHLCDKFIFTTLDYTVIHSRSRAQLELPTTILLHNHWQQQNVFYVLERTHKQSDLPSMNSCLKARNVCGIVFYFTVEDSEHFTRVDSKGLTRSPCYIGRNEVAGKVRRFQNILSQPVISYCADWIYIESLDHNFEKVFSKL